MPPAGGAAAGGIWSAAVWEAGRAEARVIMIDG